MSAVPAPVGFLADDDFLLLLEVAYVGLSGSRQDRAKELFAGLVACRPDLPHARIGLACACHTVGRRVEAFDELQRVLQDSPHHPVALGMLARLMRECGKAGWQDVADEAGRCAREVEDVEAVAALLEQEPGMAPASQPAVPSSAVPIGRLRKGVWA